VQKGECPAAPLVGAPWCSKVGETSTTIYLMPDGTFNSLMDGSGDVVDTTDATLTEGACLPAEGGEGGDGDGGARREDGGEAKAAATRKRKSSKK